MARFFAYRTQWAWALVVSLSLLVGWGVFKVNQLQQVNQSLDQLKTEALRTATELTGQTLHSNLMGSLVMLGLLDSDIKQEAANGLLSVDAHISFTLSALGNAFAAEGVFVVGEDGVVKTSWDKVGKPSTGLDVRFRPYFQSALKGQTNIYAAISMARGDRALYVTAPVFAEAAPASAGIGAVVARTNLDRVDRLLKGSFEHAILVSPQGVVFAATQPDWIGRIEGVASPERLKAIRELKQFGAKFENTDPTPLPLEVADGLQSVMGTPYALGTASVNWNDPSGAWTLVAMRDMSPALNSGKLYFYAGVGSLICMMLGWMWLGTLRAHRVQDQANQQLAVHARKQEENAAFREKLSQVSLRFQRCDSMGDLAQAFMTESRDLLGSVQAVLYALPAMGSDRLQLVGSCGSAEDPPTSIALGEGMLGQCALERRRMWFTSPVDGCWHIRSGLGNAPPPTLLLSPLVLQDTLIGVVELALLKPEHDIAIDYVDSMLALLTSSLELLRRSTHTLELLEATKIQTEAMQFQAEQLQALEEQTRLVLGAVGDGIVGLDNQGHITFANPAASSLLGFSSDEFIGKAMHELVHHHHADGAVFEKCDCPMYQTSQDGISRNITDEVLWRKDGSSFPVEYATTAIVKDGNVVGSVVVFRDDTQRKLMRVELQQERQRLQGILDNSPICVSITAMDGTILFANPVAKALFGLEVGQKAAAAYVRPEQRQELLAEIKAVGIARNVEVGIWDLAHTARTMLLTATLIQFDGQPCLMGWQIDITERKAAEQAQLEARRSLDIALESARMGTWTFHPKENRLDTDAATIRLYGLEGVELDGTMAQWFTYVDPADAQRSADLMTETMAQRKAEYKTTFMVRSPGQEPMHIMSVGRFTYDDLGNAMLAHGLVWDITSQVQTELALAQARQDVQTLSQRIGEPS